MRRRACRLALLLLLLPSIAFAVAQPLTHPPNPLPIPSSAPLQMVEPDVIYTPNGWHGFEYWMVVTPVPCGDESQENPSIFCSRDGLVWNAPTGVTNPLYPMPGDYPTHYNNDPCITFSPDSQLVIYFNYTTRGGPPNGTDVRRLISPNGISWTLPANVPTVWSRQNFPLSPTVIYDAGHYTMWYIVLATCGDASATVYRRTSTDGLTWSAESACPLASGTIVPWHFNVRKDGSKFVMIFTGYQSALGCGDAKRLYYAESTDGITWTMPQAGPIFVPSPIQNPRLWDDQTIYRTGFIASSGYLRLWYSAATYASCYPDNDSWHSGYTQGCWNGGDCLPPAAVGLGASGGCYDHIYLNWVAPGDDGTTGTASMYDLRWSSYNITEANFSSAAGIPIGSPLPAGNLENYTIYVPRCSGSRFYALKTRDAANNWSPMSNCAQAGPGCPHIGICDEGFALRPVYLDEGALAGPRSAVLDLPQPNPVAAGSVRTQFGVPAELDGVPFEIAVFDLAGRRVANVSQGIARSGYHPVEWNLLSQDGQRVGGGMYFMRFRLGAAVVQRRVIVLN